MKNLLKTITREIIAITIAIIFGAFILICEMTKVLCAIIAKCIRKNNNTTAETIETIEEKFSVSMYKLTNKMLKIL